MSHPTRKSSTRPYSLVKSSPRFILTCSVASLIAASANPARADIYDWNTANTADFNTAANWTDENGGAHVVPTTGNIADIISGGTVTVAAGDTNRVDELWAGNGGTINGNTGTGNLIVNGGSLTVNNWLVAGRGGGIGSITQNGGTITGAGNQFQVGAGGNAVGTVNLNGGTLTIGGVFNIGTDSNTALGTVNVGGTTAQINNEIWIGNSSTQNNVMTVNSGSVTGTSWVAIGRGSGTGTLTLNGGSFTKTPGTGFFDVATGAGAHGTVNLNSGATLTLDKIVTENTSATSTFNFNGGTLVANADGTRTGAPSGNIINNDPYFFQGLTAANVLAGGLTFSSNGFGTVSTPITIAQPLLHSTTATTDGGFTKNGAGFVTLSGANTFNGGVTVNAGTLTSGNVSAFPANGPLTVAAAAVNFNGQYVQAAGSTTPGLTLSKLTSAANSAYSFTLGASGADYINFATASTVAAGGKLTINPVTGATLAPGSYNLFTDAAGGLGTNTFTLANTSVTTGGFFYALSLSSTDTADVLTVGVAQIAKLYYTGATSSSLATAANYATSAAGTTASGTAPSSITDVVLTANTASNLNTTQDGLTAVNSLEFTGTGTSGTAGVTIASGTATTPLSLSANQNTFAAGTGIVVDAGAGADTISANLSLAQSQSFTNNSSNVLTVSGNISSPNANTTLTLAGAGGFALSGASTYTGGTNVTSGTVTLNSSTTGNAGPLGAAANTLTVTGNATAQGILAMNGQTVTQSSLNLFGGRVTGLTPPTGVLTLTSTGVAININPFSVATPGVAGYSNPVSVGAVTTNLALTGATSTIAKTSGFGTPVLTGGIALGGATTIALSDTGGDAAAELTLTGVISGAGSLTLNDFTNPTGVTLVGNNDFGTLLLSGTNTYTGGTNITSGRIVVTNGSALGTGTIVITQGTGNSSTGSAGGVLSLGNSNYTATSSPLAIGTIPAAGITIPNNILFGGQVAGNYGYGIYNDAGANTLSGTITLTNTNQIVNVPSGPLTFSNTVGQSAGVTAGLTKIGGGTLALTGSNSYTGPTVINAGTLSVNDLENGGVNSSTGASSNVPANLVLAGTLLYTGNGSTTDRGFTVAAQSATINNASNLTFGGQVITSGTTAGFIKEGAGTLTFTNTASTNTFGNSVNAGVGSFGLTINNGIMVLGGTPAAPLAQTNVVSNGTGGGQLIIGTTNTATSPTAELDINGGTTTVADYIGIGRGNGTNNAATTLTLNNNAVLTSGNFSAGYNNGVAGYTSSPTLNVNGTSSYTDAGVFRVGESTNGAGGVSTVNVNDTAAISMPSTTAGVFIGQGGTGVFNENGGTVTAGSTINLGTNTGITGTYNLNAGTLTAAAIVKGSGTGMFNFNGGTLRAGASDNPTATTGATTFLTGVTANVSNAGAIIDTNTFTVTAAAPLVPAGGTATGGLTKLGTGQLNLTANNTFTGATAINAGTLNIDNSTTNGTTMTAGNLSATSAITVNTGGTLLLSGATTYTNRLNDAAGITLAGGTFNLGGLSEGAAGTSGVGALTLAATSTLDFGAPGTTSNLIQFAGANRTGGTLAVTDYDTAGGTTTDHLYFAGAPSTFTTSFGQGNVSFNGNAGYVVSGDLGGYFEVSPAAVPEPATWLAGALTVGMLGYAQRRRVAGWLKLARVA